MAGIDHKYIAEVVENAKLGDSDSFAELYAATYEKQYLFACCYLKDELLAQDAIQETYVQALKNIGSLSDPKLFVSWLSQINFRVCYKIAAGQNRSGIDVLPYGSEADYSDLNATVVKVDSESYPLQQVLSLPYSESQAILLRYFSNMKLDDIAFLLETSRNAVKRKLSSGKKRLLSLLKN